ncbi:amidohydrolase family protein [Agromyces atrinae]|uniref:amidohydrolase n=1 Tax=Agromyces atrinae TaxID=592376 RepID=UPI001F562401|nr:amidohydrolase family protein [Agromyces atrinae]MCI2958295.1 amidohydrolase family protein [Agromyces atrinae]
MSDLVLAGVRRPGEETLLDVVVDAGVVTAILPAGSDVSGERIPADGRVIVPGLWDEHVHFSQWAQANGRVDLSAATSAAEAAVIVGDAIARGRREIIGAGFRDGLWPDAPDRPVLDAASGEVPVVLVSADLHCVWLNSAALRRHGFAEHPTGLLTEEDSFRVVRTLEDIGDEALDALIDDAGRAAAARGVVGIVDLEMRWNRDDWLRRRRGGFDALRVEFGIYTQHLDRAIADGMRTGDALDELITVGPYKVITDGSLNTRTAWCFDPYVGQDVDPYGLSTVPPERLLPLVRLATENGLVPAVHAIGDRANAAALDAFAELGVGGRIEHAQLLRREDVVRFAELGITASVQPEHALDDRDVAELYWSGRTDRAFMLASLVDIGATLALGSDAPVAPLDPWVTIAAAVGRTRGDREPWHPEQSISREAALAASSRGRRSVSVGDAADLVLVDADPLTVPLAELREMPVAATFLGGRATYSAL